MDALSTSYAATDALSPLDGRYRSVVDELAGTFSEAALIRTRVLVELEWVAEQCGRAELDHAPALDARGLAGLRGLGTMDARDVARVKEIERTTRHDVKAVEYWLAERFRSAGLTELVPLIHFGCTSEDINNLAYALMLRRGLREIWQPAAGTLVAAVAELARATRSVALLARTHGQPATPTTVGKELAVFAHRWRHQLDAVAACPLRGKFNGAVGTFSAHVVAFPDAPWPDISRAFVERLGLAWSPLTTQVEPHDFIAEALHAVARFNTVLADFAADISAYVSAGVLRKRPGDGEVGSSTMPHKVNPIRFENAEANVAISTALLLHLATKLPVSRLQRDLGDSSALRNVGVALGHSLVAIRSAEQGLDQLEVDERAARAELDARWEVVTEAVQTVMRKHGDADAYARVAVLAASGAHPGDLHAFVETLDIPAEDRRRLLDLEPAGYTGLATALVERYLTA